MTIQPYKKHSSISASRSFLFLSLLFVCLLITSQAASAQDNFAQRYQAYQREVNEGKAALDRKDYHTAIENYSKTIEMSPFEATQYFNRGIALYKSGKMAD